GAAGPGRRVRAPGDRPALAPTGARLPGPAAGGLRAPGPAAGRPRDGGLRPTGVDAQGAGARMLAAAAVAGGPRPGQGQPPPSEAVGQAGPAGELAKGQPSCGLD